MGRSAWPVTVGEGSIEVCFSILYQKVWSAEKAIFSKISFASGKGDI